MASDGEGAECAEVSTVFEGEEAEGDDDEKDGFFMDVPAKEKGGVATEGEGTEEGVIGGVEEEFDEAELGGLLAGL